VFSTGRRWKTGRTLRFKFLDGDERVQNKVEEYARQWTRFANLKFAFVQDGPAEIRISFKVKGQSYSLVGTDALATPQSEHTMNFGWLQPDSAEEVYSSVVLHEVGHALGLLHEHNHPKGGIHWKRSEVLKDCAAWGWTPEMVQTNIFSVYDVPDALVGTFDKASIMMYPIPRNWTTDGFTVGWNTELSEEDKRFISLVYPRQAEGEPAEGR
jgi:serralysin